MRISYWVPFVKPAKQVKPLSFSLSVYYCLFGNSCYKKACEKCFKTLRRIQAYIGATIVYITYL